MQLEDGHGSGSRLKITSSGRMASQSVVIDALHDAVHDGVGFAITVDTRTYTSAAGQSGIFYLKNTAADDVHIASSFISNTTLSRIKLWRNPTMGTLITAGTDFVPVNLNFGSGNVFTGICKTGVSGQTVTDGAIVNVINKPATGGQFDLQSSIILPRGGSLAITIEPSANTIVDFALWFYQKQHSI